MVGVREKGLVWGVCVPKLRKEGVGAGFPNKLYTDAKKAERSEVTDLEPPAEMLLHDSEVTAEVTGLGPGTAQAEVTVRRKVTIHAAGGCSARGGTWTSPERFSLVTGVLYEP